MTEVFTFRNPSNTTTSGQVETYKVYKGSNLSNDNLIASYIYTYDNNGNILTTFDGTNETRYTYDNVNQLIREDNQSKGESYVWTYDNSGNILSFGIYPYTIGDLDATGTNPIVYSYGNSMWKDLLTGLDERIITYEYEDPEISLNEDGECITLNNIGNPLFIGDPKNDNDPGNRSFTWAHGRQLQTLSQNEITWEFTYSSNGQRTGRYIKNGGSSYEYVYNDSKLMQMTVINNEETNIVNFTYDVKGLPLTMIVDGSIYYYITNLQGDVVALVDAIGTTVASYSYTAYGEVFTEGNPTIIGLNPLTYRGYIYDIETNLYYLQSRYYDPVIGRFLNSDGIIATGQGLIGNNMFSYCMNNPVGRYDSEGDASGPITDKIIHDVVLAYLCATNKDLSMTQTCVYYNGVDAWGG